MNMKNRTGVWIDHKRAVIVNYNEKNTEKFWRLESGYEGKEREAGEDRNKNNTRMGTHYITNEKGFENRHNELLRKFYLEVILRISENSEVYIFGPASAKDELAAKIRSYQSLNVTIVKIDTTDYLTDKQIAEQTRDFFHIDKIAA